MVQVRQVHALFHLLYPIFETLYLQLLVYYPVIIVLVAFEVLGSKFLHGSRSQAWGI